MKDISNHIEPETIEAYVLGLASSEEIARVERLSETNDDVRKALDLFSEAVEQLALANAIAPDPIIKPMLMATIDFMNRAEKGEPTSFPPDLKQGSTVAEFAEWLNRPDMILPSDFTDIYAKIIAHTPRATTAIVWIKDVAPQEVHHDEYEKFLIVEGTCCITIGHELHQLAAGDFLEIPLYQNHSVKVTSDVPCKAILQRTAA